jgi:hypothetical protein
MIIPRIARMALAYRALHGVFPKELEVPEDLCRGIDSITLVQRSEPVTVAAQLDGHDVYSFCAANSADAIVVRVVPV